MIRKIILIILISKLSYSQNIDQIFGDKGEIYFSFEYEDKNQLNNISKIISIDHKTNSTKAYAYANKDEFIKFLDLKINYKIIDKKKLNFSNEKNSLWNYYPSYQEYVDLMTSFADSFPNICKLHSLGTLSSGREILIVQISDNVGIKENEPSFLYTSSMHGDELSGFVLSLRLIDYLLMNYGMNNRISNLINEIDIWINPLANPDGAYYGGNQNVFSAIRYNANFIDLNRNYPDPEDGLHPDGNPYQQETNIFLALSDSVNFNMAANMHSGAEVCNYPWDTWDNINSDINWWQYVTKQYIDSCQHYGPSGYFNDLNNGITNGWDWYEVNGGRQDYMNYFRYCKEFTLELSDDKTPNPNKLNELWEANYPSFINYLEQSLFGLRGIITDSITGIPIKAKVEINFHDQDSSHVYSNLPIGNYHRYLYQGNYNITFSKFGYYPKTINISVLNNLITVKDVQLVPINLSISQELMPNNDIFMIDLIGRRNRKSNLIFKISNGKIQKFISHIDK